LFANVIISFFIYYRNGKLFSIRHSLDISGVAFMAIHSYYYHKNCAKYLDTNESIQYMDSNIIEHFITDKGGIHFRSFCCVLTALNRLIDAIPSIVSYLANSLCFLLLLLFIQRERTKSDQEKISTNQFLFTTNILTCIPILLDAAIVASTTNEIHLRFNVVTITSIIGILLQVEPFYHWNHVIIHLCLLLQSAALSLCIVHQ